MSVIKDIRLYRSNVKNVDGTARPADFHNKELNCVIHRIVMKLRENEYSLGDFDHLYINFTTSKEEGIIAPATGNTDKEFSWFRYYDVGISNSFYENLVSPNCIETVVGLVKEVLLKFFSPSKSVSDLVHNCISEAESKGEEMLMLFKVKSSKNIRAEIYLRFLNSLRYYPLIRVYDSGNKLLLEKNLPTTLTLDPFGEIVLSSKKVTIKPRKNAWSQNLEPIVVPISQDTQRTNN